MFARVCLFLLLSVEVFALEILVKVVELDSVVRMSSGDYSETCTIKDSGGCTFKVPERNLISVEVSGPFGNGFSSDLLLKHDSSVEMYVHLKRQSHYLVFDKKPAVGDVINSRLLSGLIIPQSTGKRRERVMF